MKINKSKHGLFPCEPSKNPEAEKRVLKCGCVVVPYPAGNYASVKLCNFHRRKKREEYFEDKIKKKKKER